MVSRATNSPMNGTSLRERSSKHKMKRHARDVHASGLKSLWADCSVFASGTGLL